MGSTGKSRTIKLASIAGILVAFFGAFEAGGGGTEIIKKLVRSAGAPGSPHKYAILVQKASDSTWITGATVELVVGADAKHLTTDTDGRVVFPVPASEQGTAAHVYVSAPGFHSVNRQVTIPTIDGSDEFALVSEDAPRPRQPYFRELTTGPVPSGSGANWSQWYALTSEPPETGYSIDLSSGSTYFTVSGDRNCTSNPALQEMGWLHCQWLQKDQQRVSFQFQLQGHNEWSGSGQALSTGRLHVTYVPSN